MRLILSLSFIVFLMNSSTAQRNRPANDSMRYYQRELVMLNKEYRDSLRNDPRYAAIIHKLDAIRIKSDNYVAFALYMNMVSANFSKFNADNAQSNFGSFSSPMLGLGYAISSKKKRRIFDFNVSAFGIAKKIKKEAEFIKLSFSTFFQLEWGYDLINSPKVNIYPYAGLGLRSSNMEYKAPDEANPAYTNITNITQNNRSVSDFVTEPGYQAGMGFEFAIPSARKRGGIMLMLKAGTNRAFSKKSFSLAGLDYDPQFNYGEWTVSTGVKFFGR